MFSNNMALTTGVKLGPYEILGPLGFGGMGEVYRAVDTKLKRDVAIKVLPEALAGDSERLARFEREAQVLASLNNPHIAAIYGVEDSTSVKALVMELVDGSTLQDRLDAGPIPLEEALPVAREIAEALEAAHGKGIIHRDLKPANVKITSDGLVKVLDFGLAKALDPGAPGSSPDLTHSPTITYQGTAAGIILGTAAYMSPEQARGAAADKRADVWAFGVVLWEMLTGRRLFQGETVSDTLAAVLRADIDLGALPRAASPGLRRLVRRCLERNPKNRLHDIADARLVLDDVLAGREDEASAGGAAAARRRTVSWGSLALGLAGGAAVGAAAAWFLARRAAPAVPAEPPSVHSLTYSGSSWAPSISPDGKTLAFTSDRDGTARIWLQQLATGEEAALTSAGIRPEIAPDSASLLFENDGGIFRVPLIGGAPRKIAGGALPAWSPDGAEIAFVAGSGKGIGIFRIAAQGGQRRLIAEEPEFGGGAAVDAGLRWSPDGARLAYVRSGRVNSVATTSIGVLEVASGERRTVLRLPAGSLLFGLAWDGKDSLLYAWSPTQAGGRGALLRKVPIRGGPPRTLFAFSSTPDEIRLAGRGALVFGVKEQRQNLYEVDGKNPRGKALTRGPTIDRQPAFSPDGKRIAFTSDRAGHFDIWSLELSTGAVRRLTFDDADDWDPQYSPDGEHLLWSSNRSGNFEVWIAEPDGTGARQLTNNGVDAQNPTMSGDGRWVVYSTGNPDGPGIWKIRSDGTDAKVLIPGSFVLPELSPTTGWVAASESAAGRAPGLTTIRVVRLEEGAPVASVKVEGDLGNSGRSRWMPDGRTLLAWSGHRGRTVIYRIPIEPGLDLGSSELVPLLVGGPGQAFESFGVSPADGRIVVSSLSVERDIRIAEGISGIGESLPDRRRSSR
jgi:Tol biopolymer transport system component